TDLNITCRTDYFLSACGFNISLTTLALIGLYVLWLIEIRRDQPVARFRRNPQLGLNGKAAAGFILASILSLLAAKDIGLALYQLWIYLTLFALFFYLANNINTQQELLYVLLLLFLGLLVQNVIMQLQGFGLLEGGLPGQLKRVNGTFHSPNNAAGYL